jgi:hypothetical protein
MGMILPTTLEVCEDIPFRISLSERIRQHPLEGPNL